MNANDLRLYQTVEKYCQELGLKIILTGDSFELINQKGGTLGRMENLDKLYHYICGYQEGFSKGKCCSKKL